MTEILLLKFAHILCLVYWLGGDLGVFYSSSYVADPNNSPQTRVTVAKILFALDQAPRICMTMILPTGISLAYKLGVLDVSATVVAITWVICLGWLAMVLILHFSSPKPGLTTFDFWFRILLVLFLLGVAIYALTQDKLIRGDWASYKLLVFATMVVFGLLIRVKLRPFGPAFGQLVQGNVDDTINSDIRDSLASVKPFVLGIWAGLLINTAFGLHLF